MRKFSLYLLLLSYLGYAYGQTDSLLLNQTIIVDSTVREYHVFLPDTTTDAPIVFIFHGHTETHNSLLGIDRNGGNLPNSTYPYRPWLDIARSENIILVVPNGYRKDSLKGWNDCRADGVGNSDEDDVLFVSMLIDTLLNTFNADPDRVYASGTSNGGHLCIRLAQEIPEKIAAIAPVSASNAANPECFSSTVPISVLFMNGTSDPLLPYAGGQMAGNRGEVVSMDSSIHYWTKRNNTASVPVVTAVPDLFQNDNCTITKYEYGNGDNGTCVAAYTVMDGGHASPSSTQRYNFPFVPLVLGNQNGDIEMAEVVWDFFESKSNVATSIAEVSIAATLNLYPNPASTSFTLDLGQHQHEGKSVKLINSIGQTVKVFHGTTDSFDIQDIPTGIYIVHIAFNEGSVMRRLVKL